MQTATPGKSAPKAPSTPTKGNKKPLKEIISSQQKLRPFEPEIQTGSENRKGKPEMEPEVKLSPKVNVPNVGPPTIELKSSL